MTTTDWKQQAQERMAVQIVRALLTAGALDVPRSSDPTLAGLLAIFEQLEQER